MLTDILINVPAENSNSAAVSCGLAFAKRFDAHVTGAASGIEPTISVGYFGAVPGDLMLDLHNAAEQAAREASRRFSKAAENAGVKADALAFASTFGSAIDRFSQLARVHDLTIVDQPNPDRSDAEDEFLRAALFESGRAVLVVPYVQKTPIELNRVLIAWDGGRAATRAVAEARPILARAKQVEVLVVETGRQDQTLLPGADIAQHLARHRLKVELHCVLAPSRTAIDSTILNAVTEGGIDLVVMGGYGHSRLRDFVLGGVTGGIIESMTAPVLMAN